MLSFTRSIVPVLALLGLAAAVPAGKPTGGPASTTVTIYSGPFSCTDPNTPPPTTGSAGTSSVISVAENQCVIVNVPFGGVFTASMTATPKTGTTACYVQIFSQQGCGLTLQNQYHGFPFDGIVLGSKVGCASPPGQTYGGVEIVCA